MKIAAFQSIFSVTYLIFFFGTYEANILLNERPSRPMVKRDILAVGAAFLDNDDPVQIVLECMHNHNFQRRKACGDSSPTTESSELKMFYNFIQTAVGTILQHG